MDTERTAILTIISVKVHGIGKLNMKNWQNVCQILKEEPQAWQGNSGVILSQLSEDLQAIKVKEIDCLILANHLIVETAYKRFHEAEKRFSGS